MDPGKGDKQILLASECRNTRFWLPLTACLEMEGVDGRNMQVVPDMTAVPPEPDPMKHVA